MKTLEVSFGIGTFFISTYYHNNHNNTYQATVVALCNNIIILTLRSIVDEKVSESVIFLIIVLKVKFLNNCIES